MASLAPDNWTHEIDSALPVTSHRMGNGSWIAVWCTSDSCNEGYGHRHPDACFSVDELEASTDWQGLVRERLGL